MALTKIICIVLSYLLLVNAQPPEQQSSRQFPKDFIFGTATSAYQVEGAWNEDGKGWSIWDYSTHTDPGFVTDQSNGDIATNSYYNYKRDIQMLKELGVQAYRFSISWPRILPYGRRYINPRGVEYYNNLIDELLANDIVPFVTIYHWDLPQNLQETGGWLDEEIVDSFGDYARLLFTIFGDRVKNWLTINEPSIHCWLGYGQAIHAPRIYSPGLGYYECGRQILLANARAYHIYDEEFRATQNGRIGLVYNMDWILPKDNSTDDKEAALDTFAFENGQYVDPVWSKSGNYPQRMIDRIAAASADQGLRETRLRPFTEEQVEYIKGTADFISLNHYVTRYVYRNSSVTKTCDIPSKESDICAETSFVGANAPGFYSLLMYLKETYNNPDIYITENGMSSDLGLKDTDKIQYIKDYLNAVLDALESGVRVKAYFAWSLMDNFEWASGYTKYFGLFQVDMKDPERTRTPKSSASAFRDIVKTRRID